LQNLVGYLNKENGHSLAGKLALTAPRGMALESCSEAARELAARPKAAHRSTAARPTTSFPAAVFRSDGGHFFPFFDVDHREFGGQHQCDDRGGFLRYKG
jgi:hypothetical protein